MDSMGDAYLATLRQLDASRSKLANDSLAANAGSAEDCPAMLQLTTAGERVLEAEAYIDVAGPGQLLQAVDCAAELAGKASASKDPQLRSVALDNVVIAARALARLQHQRARRAAAAAAHARLAGEIRHALEAALEAGQAAGLAVWAASLGGCDLMCELRGPQEDAMRAAEAAAKDARLAEKPVRSAMALEAAVRQMEIPGHEGQVAGPEVVHATDVWASQRVATGGEAPCGLAGSGSDAASVPAPSNAHPADSSSSPSAQPNHAAAVDSGAVCSPQVSTGPRDVSPGACVTAVSQPLDTLTCVASEESGLGDAVGAFAIGQGAASPAAAEPPELADSCGGHCLRPPGTEAAAPCAAAAPSAPQAAPNALSTPPAPAQVELQPTELDGRSGADEGSPEERGRLTPSCDQADEGSGPECGRLLDSASDARGGSRSDTKAHVEGAGAHARTTHLPDPAGGGRVSTGDCAAGPSTAPASGPPCCSPNGPDEPARLVSELASVARHMTPGGDLPADVLRAAYASARNLLHSNQAREWDKFADEFASPSHRIGVMQLLSLAVRWVAQGPSSELCADAASAAAAYPAAGLDGRWYSWGAILQACMRLLLVFAGACAETAVSPTAGAELRALHRERFVAVAATMLRTDLLPALSRVTAAAAAAAAAFADSSSNGAGDGSSIGRGDGSGGVAESQRRVNVQELQWWNFAVDGTCSHLNALHGLSFGADSKVVEGFTGAPLRLQLIQAVRESHVLEHSARAVMALLGLFPCCVALASRCQKLLSRNLRDLLQFACTPVPPCDGDAKQGAAADGVSPDGGDESSWPLLAHSSRCLQHLLLLHTLAQLCAVDEGTDYGLPPGAALPAITARGEAVWPAEQRNGAAHAADVGTEPVLLRMDAVCSALKCWASMRSSPPCACRSLQSLGLRLAAAARMPSAAPDGDGGGVQYRFMTPDLVELRALLLANRAACSNVPGVWVRAVRAVRRVMAAPHLRGAMSEEAADLLVDLCLPHCPVGRSLPIQPSRDVEVALASGYVACMETALRQQARLHGDPARAAARCLSLSGRLFLTFWKVFTLLGYEPRLLASLLATGVKVLKCGLMEVTRVRLAALMGEAPPAGAQPTPEQIRALCSDLGSKLTATYNQFWDAADVHQEDRYWWRAWRGAATAGGHTGGGVEGEIASGSASSSGAGSIDRDGGRLSPLQQQMLLCTWALMHVLPVMARTALLAPSAPPSSDLFNYAILPWVPPLVLAYLDCRAAAAAATAAAASDSRRASAAAAADAEAAAASWRCLLLKQMGLARVLAVMAPQGLCDREGVWAGWCGINYLADALLHFAVAFPDEARVVLGSRFGGSGSTLLQVAKRWGAESDCEAARFFTRVIAAVGAGRQPAAWMVERLRSGDYRPVRRREESAKSEFPPRDHTANISSALRAAPLLLPPPCVAAALLRLPLCANPGCTNLEGDSEAGLPLFGCRRCGGRVAYCSRECQVAHWRAGHREECCAPPSMVAQL